MERSAKHKILTLLNLVVWSGVVIVGSGKIELFAKPSVTVTLTTTPTHVRLGINGKKHEMGQYLETPLSVAVSPGKSKIKISREGFVTHIITVEGSSGETLTLDNVTLQPLQSAKFTSVEVQSGAEGMRYYGDIDDGIGRGELPLKIKDLQAEVPHILTIYPEWPKRLPRLRCRFTPPESLDPEAPYLIDVKIRQDKLRANGCSNLKEKKSL